MSVSQMLISLGAAAFVAALVGGGLKAFEIELPIIASKRRQLALGLCGMIFLALGLALELDLIPKHKGAGSVQRPTSDISGPPSPRIPEFNKPVQLAGWSSNRDFIEFLKENDGSIIKLNTIFDLSSLSDSFNEIRKICNLPNIEEELGKKKVKSRGLYNIEQDIPILFHEGDPVDWLYGPDPELREPDLCTNKITIHSTEGGPNYSTAGTGTSSYKVNSFFKIEASYIGSWSHFDLTEVPQNISVQQ